MKSLTALALVAALSVGVLPAREVRAESDGLGGIMVATVGGIAAGGLAILDLTMLGIAIGEGQSAWWLWEGLGLGLGAAGIGVGTVLLLADDGAEGTALGAVGLGVGLALGAGAVWSMTLPDAPADGVSAVVLPTPSGLAVVGRF